MRKRIIPVVLVMIMFFTVTAHAVTPYALTQIIRLSFDGTTAECYASIVDGADDVISGTLELWCEDTLVKSWSDTSTCYFCINKVTAATRGKSYTLILNYSVNGVSQQPLSTSKTCR